MNIHDERVNMHVQLSSETRCLICCLILHLYLYFVCASKEDSGESVQMHRC